MDHPEIRPEVAAFHQRCTVADLHADTFLWRRLLGYDIGKRHRSLVPRNPLFNHIDIPRAVEGGLNITGQGVVAHPFGASRCYDRGMKMIETIGSGVARYPDSLELALTATQAREIVARGKIAVFIGVEGAHILSGRMEAADRFHQKGMRYLTLGHFSENQAVYSSNDARNADRELKPFGRQLIKRLEELKVMIDLAHTARGCFWDVIRTVTRPVIVSHIGMKAVRGHWRNLDDEQALAVARTGGVIGIIFAPGFLSRRWWICDLDVVVEHIEHCMQVAGEDHVALGSDWDGFITVARSLEDVTGLPRLTQRLLDRGHSQQTVSKILGENFLRVFKEVCG